MKMKIKMQSLGALLGAPRPWLLAFALVAAGSVAAQADEELLDVSKLPHMEGAKADPGRSSASEIVYSIPGTVPNTIAETKKVLAAEGWKPYASPSEDPIAISVAFKKGALGMSAFFMNPGPNQTAVSYSRNRLYVNLPVPDDATDLVFDEHRPYLKLVTSGTVDATLAFFDKELAASGWSPLSATDAVAHWPNATLDDKAENGARAYYINTDQEPVVLALTRTADGKTSAEIRTPPFAEPQFIEAGPDMGGLPAPKRYKSAGNSGGDARREAHAKVPAEVSTMLAFYRRELTARGWKEEAKGAVLDPDQVALTFSSEEGTIALKLGHQYDLTLVSLVLQVSPAILAAKAKAQKDEDDKFVNDALAIAGANKATAAAKRAATADVPDGAPLRPMAEQVAPVPVPENSEDVEFDGRGGRLEFNTPASVKAVAAFYRAAMKPLGWKEQPSVINNGNMIVVEFSKGGKELSFTIMQMGANADVSATGSGLLGAAGKSDRADAGGAAKPPAQDLEADDAPGLPVPKEHSLSAPGTVQSPGETPFRHELDASVPADLSAVLAFYRRELTKREWKEVAKGAVVKADKVVLAFTSPEGPALLRLGRQNGETTINLALKNPAEAAKAGIAPTRGQVKFMFGNVGNAEAVITINKRAIKIPPGAGSPTSPAGPTLELPPGKYKYSLTVAGRPGRASELEVSADDTWGLMVSPAGDDVMALHMY